MLASDLQGLGVSPLLAARTATGGTGPIPITPVGASYASGTKLGATQFLVTANGATATVISLPPIGSDNGALIGDDYIINNQGSSSVLVFASTSVYISMGGSLTVTQRVQSHTSATFFPVSSTYTAGAANWIGVAGS